MPVKESTTASSLRMLINALLVLLLAHRAYAGILDANALKEEQQAFCAEHSEKLATGWVVNEELLTQAAYRAIKTNMRLVVYKKNDAVSASIMKNGGWEEPSVYNLYAMMHNYMLKHGQTDRSRMTFVDIGANVGVYTVPLAKAGFDVLAFEPMQLNVDALKASICLNNLSKCKVALYPYGLGTEQQECPLFSKDSSNGSSSVDCTPGFVIPEGHTQFGMATIKKLDDFYEQVKERNVIALKMDVEGFELYVVKGGLKVFFEKPIPYIQMKLNTQALKERGADPFDLLRTFAKHGYEVHRHSFEGPVIPNRSMTTETHNFPSFPCRENLFLIHESTSAVKENAEQRNEPGTPTSPSFSEQLL